MPKTQFFFGSTIHQDDGKGKTLIRQQEKEPVP